MLLACARAHPPTLRSAQPRSRLLPRAAAQSAAGGGGGGTARLRRESVEIIVPGQHVLRAKHVTQRDLNNIITAHGAVGFVADDGQVSQQLADLPEGGSVKLFMPRVPTMATQMQNVQGSLANITRGKEQQLVTKLVNLASAEAPGAPLTTLQSAPYRNAAGQDCVQLDAAVRVGGDTPTLYLGEHKSVLGEDGLIATVKKLKRLRAACASGASPDLAAALQGVAYVRLFLAGEVVREGLTVQEFVEAAAAVDVSVVLPSAQGLEVVGPAPAVRL